MADSVGTQLPANLVEPETGPRSPFMFHDPATDHFVEFTSFSSNRSKLSLRPLNSTDHRNLISDNRARDRLLAVSHDVKSALSPAFLDTHPRTQHVRLKIDAPAQKLMVAGATMKTEPETRIQSNHHLREVSLKPSSALHRIRTVTALHDKKGHNSTEVFLNGRNVINRLMQDTIRANQEAHQLTDLRDKVEDQRAESLFRTTIRRKERRTWAGEIAEKRKLMRTSSEKDIKRKMAVELHIRERLKTSVKEKRVPPRPLLFLNTFDPGQLPPTQEHTFTLNDLQALLTAVKPKRFRFK